MQVFKDRACHGRSRRMDATGFTLIELMVVISVIALLVAILLPALSRARTTVQKTVSLSNIRQVSVALFLYANDNRQSMPYAQVFSATDSRWAFPWSRVLYESQYVSSLEVFWSPAREIYGGEFPHTLRATEQYAHTFESVGYGLSRGVYGSTGYGHQILKAPAPIRLDESGSPPPVQMLLLAEAYSRHSFLGGRNGYFIIRPGEDTSSTTSTGGLFNYNGSVVRSYLDGHALAMGRVNPTSLISGNQAHVGLDHITQPSPNEIGWDINRPTYSGDLEVGPYAGQWAYASLDDGRYHTPWFDLWRTQWHAGLR